MAEVQVTSRLLRPDRLEFHSHQALCAKALRIGCMLVAQYLGHFKPIKPQRHGPRRLGRKLSGIGVITRVVSRPPRTACMRPMVFIRIRPVTQLTSLGDLDSSPPIPEHWLFQRNAKEESSKPQALFLPETHKVQGLKDLEIATVKNPPRRRPRTMP